MPNIYKALVTESQSTFIHTPLCILAIVVFLPLASLALPIWLVFLLFQWIAATWILFWQMGQILAAEDVPFAQKSTLGNFVTCLVTVKGSLNVRNVRKAFRTKILESTHESYVRLKQCVRSKMGRYIRKDEKNFDIKKHIIVYKGAPPGNDKELAECHSQLINRDIPNNLSPWQLIIIPRGKRFGAKEFAICVRIHHTIGDGFALVGLFSKIVDNEPILLQPSTRGEQTTSRLRKLIRAIYTAPLVLLCILASSIENPFVQKAERAVGAMKVAWTKSIDLAEIKRIKSKFGATINDVLTACLAGAMRRYLKKSGVDSPKDLQIAVTINTRNPPYEEIPLGNNTAGVFVSLPVATSCLAERILETKRRMDMVKGSSEYLLFGFLFRYFIATLPECIARFSKHAINRSCCMVMSNVPGPMNQLEFVGNVVESAMVWPPLISDTGISVAVFSYAGKIRVSVKVDTGVIANPMELMDDFTLEVEDLVRLSE